MFSERGLPASAYPSRLSQTVGKRITHLDKARLAQLFSPGQWEKVNLLAMLNDGLLSSPPHVKLFVWHAPAGSHPTFEEATNASNNFKETATGNEFGPSWSTHWFKVILTLPEWTCSKPQVELHWDCNNEATVWTEDGKPLHGLTGRGERIEWIIPDSFKDGKSHVVFVEMACNGMFGNGPGRPIFKNIPGGDSIQPPDQNKYFLLSKAEICVVNLEARMLYMDIVAIHDAAIELPDDTWQQHKALSVGTRIMNTFQAGSTATIMECRKIAQELLGAQIDHKDLYSGSDYENVDVYAVGHCHIDTCWLWPWAETRRKIARSWLNQCDLMDRYPELTFVCSQAQQFQWLKRDYPHAWDRVMEKVRSGQFQPIGGCWVEHDTNIPNGESLVRQFFYGQRFFEANFGFRSRVLWLPDSFGFSSQLPQLARQAGMPYFLTQKICFNNINKFPHTSFNWVGLDGSQLLSHMPPVQTYTADGTVADIRRCVTKHLTMDQDHTSLMAFGKGDGGGGPTWQHLERLRRCRGISETVGLLPKVQVGSSADSFFSRLEKKAASLPTWNGDLYFELHRGTYTTQSTTKQRNRKAEFLLRDIEQLATIASIENSDFQYPNRDIQFMWQEILLCQFHDCLPGTAIRMCYDDSDKVYERTFEAGNKILRSIYQALDIEMIDENSRDLKNAFALNTLLWPHRTILAIPGCQELMASGDGCLLGLSSLGTQLRSKIGVTCRELGTGVFELQNRLLSIKVERGCITSLYDRNADREVIPQGMKGNQFVIFDDKPIYWQAWDVEIYHLDTRKELIGDVTTISEITPHRVSVTTTTKISDKSVIRSTISLSSALEYSETLLETTAEIDWHESMTFLKVEFPVNVRNTEASYETQYGINKRPTHYNTSWDMAKFEVCCQKFADLSEYGYGVSILNNGKYGFATVGNVMRLSLLRSSKAPDDTADMGRHTIRWAIMPHSGQLGARTVRAAFDFNNPLKLVRAMSEKRSILHDYPISLQGDDSLVLDTIKRGEDDEDISLGELAARKGRSVILRIYDSLGGRSRGIVAVNWRVSKVYRTNILEDDIEEVSFQKGKFSIELGPFEVSTYRICLEG